MKLLKSNRLKHQLLLHLNEKENPRRQKVMKNIYPVMKDLRNNPNLIEIRNVLSLLIATMNLLLIRSLEKEKRQMKSIVMMIQ